MYSVIMPSVIYIISFLVDSKLLEFENSILYANMKLCTWSAFPFSDMFPYENVQIHYITWMQNRLSPLL